jgi:alkyl hydroperoxide reductase subunit AhpF
MALLNENIQAQVRQALEMLEAPVKIVVFTQASGGGLELECTMCADTRQLAEEVAALSDKLSVEVKDFIQEAGEAGSYEIDKIPAIAIVSDGPQPKDYGLRLYGIPSGYEFSSFIHALLLVSRNRPELSPETLQALSRLDQPVHIQVYVTPT